MAGRDSAKRIGGDALAVAMGQLVSFVYPLVSLPLLARILSADGLGRLMIIIGVLQLLISLIDYGFSVSAVRRMALARSNRELSRVIGNTLGAAGLLWLVGSVVLLGIVAAVPALRDEWIYYLIGCLAVSGSVGFPIWLLQGLQRLVRFAVITAISRVLALLGLLLTVRESTDLGLALFWQFAPLLIATCVVWPYLIRQRIRPCRPTWAGILDSLRDGRALFVSTIASSLGGPMSTVTLGVVSTPAQVAFFGAADRFGNAGRGVLFSVVRAMMPRMARAHRGEPVRTSLIVGGLAASFASGGLVLILSASWLVPWYLGEGYDAAIPVTRLVGLALIVSGGVGITELLLNAAHRYRDTAAASLIGAIIHIGLLVPIGAMYGAVGAGAVLVISELSVFGFLLVRYVKVRREDSPIQEAEEVCQ